MYVNLKTGTLEVLGRDGYQRRATRLSDTHPLI